MLSMLLLIPCVKEVEDTDKATMDEMFGVNNF